MIKRAGPLISQSEIEGTLLLDPAVAEVCVFVIPHPDLGEDVAAAVVVRPVAVVTERLLRERVASCLSTQKMPRVIAFVTEILKTPTGKPMRRESRRSARWGHRVASRKSPTVESASNRVYRLSGRGPGRAAEQ